MNEYKLKEKLKSEIKTDLINYYDSLKFSVDIEAQKIIIHVNDKHLINDNLFLIEKIDQILNSNMNDVNQFFTNWSQVDEDYWSKIYHKDNDTMMIKEELKHQILKNYLICIKNKKDKHYYFDFNDSVQDYFFCTKIKQFHLFGLHLEFEYYIDEKQQFLIE